MSEAATEATGVPARLPVIAIIGRTNAGKSTLFNRLTKTQRALVDAEPGVTRDRNFAEVRAEGRRFLLVDTGGFEAGATGDLESEVLAQSGLAIEEADAIIYLVDGRAGVSPADREVAQRLRQSRKPVWLAVNKLDTPRLDDDAADFFTLGIEHVVSISASHGRGVGDLFEELLATVSAPAAEEQRPAQGVSIAIVGRPNVGKSSLLNRLLGYERSIVTPIAGTTRDAIDTPFEYGGQHYVLVDTAGIRRRPKVHEHLERASAVRALRALERCEVAVLLVDAGEPVADQDARIAGYAWEGGRGLVLVVNKSDLLGTPAGEARFATEIRRQYPFLDDVELLFTSAQAGTGLDAVMPAVQRAADNHRRQIPTAELNQVIHGAVDATPPPVQQGKRLTIQYAVQTGVRPPTITLFCNAPERMPAAYARYLVNRLRAAFALTGTPLRLHYRARERKARVGLPPEGRKRQVKRRTRNVGKFAKRNP